MSEFSHLRNKLLAEQVEDQIYHYILDTPIEPGAKLPNEFALAEKFRVGRSTIREAVKLLSSKGIVEVRQGSGTYVVTTVKGLSDPLNLRSVQDKNALAFDLVNVRLLLEPGIAEMAAQNATPEDIERLRRLCERVETKIHEGDRYIEDDIAFHTCIAESSKNLVVGQLIPVIDTAVMMFVNVTHKKLIDETIMTHRMITEAIANHDKKTQAYVGAYIGQAYILSGQADSMFTYFNAAITYVEEHHDTYIQTIIANGLGINARNTTLNYNASLAYFQEALQYADASEDKTNYYIILSNMTRIYYLRNVPSGIKYALEVYEGGS